MDTLLINFLKTGRLKLLLSLCQGQSGGNFWFQQKAGSGRVCSSIEYLPNTKKVWSHKTSHKTGVSNAYNFSTGLQKKTAVC